MSKAPSRGLVGIFFWQFPFLLDLCLGTDKIPVYVGEKSNYLFKKYITSWSRTIWNIVIIAFDAVSKF
jgi:hypothetical protein